MSKAAATIHLIFLISLPVVVAVYGLSVLSAVLLVLALLLWRWIMTVLRLLNPPTGTELELETISASHFVEKARWCLDRLGVKYKEKHTAGILGVLFRGRTVPVLRMPTGRVTSEIGNSAEILRYLWGRYAAEMGDAARFLEPTSSRLEWEKRLDEYGVHLQVWVYSHALDHRDLTLHAWGRDSKKIPLLQRGLIVVLYPLLATFIKHAFKLSESHYERAKADIEVLLADVEKLLESGQTTLTGEADVTFADITFAALSGLWLMPHNYGGGAASDCMIARDQFPPKMRADVEHWIATYPQAERFVQQLYREERLVSNEA